MFRLAIKKMINNRILMLSLFIGILVAVLIACTIPVYSQGISHRMLVTQLENYQNEYKISPGANIISCSLTAFRQQGSDDIVDKNDSSANVNNFNYCTNYLENKLYPRLNMPSLIESITLSSTTLKGIDIKDIKKKNICDIVVKAVNTYENAVEIIDGRQPENKLDEDGCVEVMISRATQANTKFTLGNIVHTGYTTEGIFNDCVVKLKVVGIFDYKSDPYNPIVDKEQGKEFYCNYDYFFNVLFVEKNLVSTATWYFAGDYTKFDPNKTESTISALNELNNNLTSWGLVGNSSTSVPPIKQYLTYYDNVNSVNVLLVLFYAPVLILVIFFIFMISKFVLENDKNEIAMLNSRGSSRKQILYLYFIQGGTIALLSIILAPILAMLVCNILGATSGFLEFSQSAPLKIELSFYALIFSFVAAILALLTMLIPVYKASKIEIVQHKRKTKSPIWINIALTILTLILFIVTFYAYYVLVDQKEGLLMEAGGVQPLAYVFLISLYAAIALLFVLIYPLILKFILKFGKSKWKADKFSAFSRISKLEASERFIVIFLTLTIAIGAFSSISARTLNKNLDRSTDYQYPCDIIADVKYYSVGSGINRRYLFNDVEGIEATKVIKGNNPRITNRLGDVLRENVTLMGIYPKEFENIISWDDSILPQKISYYLNKLESDKNTCIISKNTAKALDVKVGDSLSVRVDENLKGGQVVTAKILDIVEAWPTYYSSFVDKNDVTLQNYLIVLNNNAIEEITTNQEYSVWLNTDFDVNTLKNMTIKLGASADDYRDRVSARLDNIINGAREQYLSQINSVRQATNGSLTLGFIAVIFVCAVGFIIYWLISIKSRMLQIGTMRALGMSFDEVFNMVIWEQILLCAAAVIVGLGSGILSGILFSPLLQSAFGRMGEMPPYIVSINFVDIIKLLILIALLIGVSVGAAVMILKRIKAATAIKLGEE